jgi:hypothetical protein
VTKIQSEGTVEPSLARRGGLDPSDPAYAGQAQYTRSYLSHVYDPLVVHLTNRFLWRCPIKRILALYSEHLTGRHLEVGPGTGWFLAHSLFPMLGSGVPHSPPSRALVRSLNKKGVFGNRSDDPASLERALEALGRPYTMELCGTAGVFTVRA